MAVNDEIFKNLEVYRGGTINERVYNFLGSLGYTGTINDRLGQFEEGGRKGWQGLIRAWGQWAPAQLFSQGQEGVWYEPKPIVAGQQVLYQDSAGTTPVSADGDPVGLMLDRHLGLVLGPELAKTLPVPVIVDGDGSQGRWDADTWTFYNDGDVASNRPRFFFDLGLTQGVRYSVSIKLSGNIDKVSGSVPARLTSSGLLSNLSYNQNTGLLSGNPEAGTSGGEPRLEVWMDSFAQGESVTIDNISVRELPGNHATQSTSAARPIYRTNGALHWIEFDGVDDHLAVPGMPESSGILFGLAIKTPTATNPSRILHSANSLIFGQSTGGTGSTGYYDGSWNDAPVDFESPKSVLFLLSGGTGRVLVNGAELLSGSYNGRQFGADAKLASNSAGSANFSTFNCYGMLLRDSAVNAPDAEHVSEYLAAKAGIAL